jgi:membrane associated rhomboid family serine protease
MRTATRDIYGNSTQMTFGVQMLLFANIAVFAVEYLFGLRLSALFALRSNWWTTLSIWQLITYQFLHQGLGHLFSNALGLYFLGPEVERTLGTNRFFALYFLSGVLGGLGWSLLSPSYAFCIGASGAVFGILGAYAALYPNRELVLIFLPFFPIKAWVFVLLLGAYEFMHTLGGSGGHIANAAHLGGGIAGYVYAGIIGHSDLLQKLKKRFGPGGRPPVSRVEIDRILDKAAQHGINALSRRERELLKRAGR